MEKYVGLSTTLVPLKAEVEANDVDMFAFDD
jgi:hypothetical protein